MDSIRMAAEGGEGRGGRWRGDEEREGEQPQSLTAATASRLRCSNLNSLHASALLRLRSEGRGDRIDSDCSAPLTSAALAVRGHCSRLFAARCRSPLICCL